LGNAEKGENGMTRDEILAMEPGRELDALVAEKVMGWTVFRSETPNHYDLLDEEYAHGFPPGEDINSVPFEIEEYTTDISPAWKVLEKHRNRKNLVTLVGDEKKWKCRITAMINVVYGIDVHDTQCEFKTAPEAICKAALLAVMGQEAS
jgi:hypothetical protein